MEIERKFLIKKGLLPAELESYPFHEIEQGYLCTNPVVRIRRQDDEYYLTYKSQSPSFVSAKTMTNMNSLTNLPVL